MIQDFGRHKSPKFTHDAWVVYRVLRTSFFDDLEEINAAYEIQANFVSLYITVFQLANLGLLEFFFFFDKHLNEQHFGLFYMDTDLLCLAAEVTL